MEVVGKLLWKQAQLQLSDGYFACAKVYTEKACGIWYPSKFKDDLLGLVWSERNYHPIKEYFSKLTLDRKNEYTLF